MTMILPDNLQPYHLPFPFTLYTTKAIQKKKKQDQTLLPCGRRRALRQAALDAPLQVPARRRAPQILARVLLLTVLQLDASSYLASLKGCSLQYGGTSRVGSW